MKNTHNTRTRTHTQSAIPLPRNNNACLCIRVCVCVERQLSFFINIFQFSLRETKKIHKKYFENNQRKRLSSDYAIGKCPKNIQYKEFCKFLKSFLS